METSLVLEKHRLAVDLWYYLFMCRHYIEEICEKLADHFSQNPEIRFAYVFGSLAKGTQNKLSDLDIAVFLDYLLIESKTYPYGYKAALITELMQLLKLNEVDLVVLNEATPLLKYEVVRYGFLFYEVEPEERILFQVSAFSRYFDLKPFFRGNLALPIFQRIHEV